MAKIDVKENIHEGLKPPANCREDECIFVKGIYHYYHYICDGQKDRGWGCGYRTLQTICSWVKYQKNSSVTVPSITAIQEALVAMGDKPASFKGSREWIGSVEVAMVVDYFFDEPCKIVHVTSGKELKNHTEELKQHFLTKGAPVMMGGDSDASSKGIIGLCQNESETYLLILDPHYHGERPSQQTLVENNFLVWRNVDDFMDCSFYNLCLCQHKGKDNK